MKYHAAIAGYEIYTNKYMGNNGRMCNEWIAYKAGTQQAEVYKVSRASKKALLEAIA